jgi:hypothetical protein
VSPVYGDDGRGQTYRPCTGRPPKQRLAAPSRISSPSSCASDCGRPTPSDLPPSIAPTRESYLQGWACALAVGRSAVEGRTSGGGTGLADVSSPLAVGSWTRARPLINPSSFFSIGSICGSSSGLAFMPILSIFLTISCYSCPYCAEAQRPQPVHSQSTPVIHALTGRSSTASASLLSLPANPSSPPGTGEEAV